MRRLALLGLLGALAAAGCGGSEGGDVKRQVSQPPAPPADVPDATAGATAEQLAFRRELLRQLEDGTYVPCTCTGEIRAKERIASGKVRAPVPDQPASALP